jgi:protein-tyrosine phosphatase
MSWDYSVLEPGLALSAHPQDAASLADLPFQAVLNVCDFGEPSYVRRLPSQTRVVRRPFEDGWAVPFPWLVAAVLELADLRGRGVRTLVHCHLGRSRSPTVVALFWMARDDIDWQTAVARLEAQRRCHLRPDGQSPLVDASARSRALEVVRAFLRGEAELLRRFREKAERFTSACQGRSPDPAPRGGDWNLVEDDLAVGEGIPAWPVFTAYGFDCILIVRAAEGSPVPGALPPGAPTAVHTFPVEGALNAGVLRAPVQQLEEWRRQGRRVFVLGPSEDFFAVVVACVWLMESRGWDAASAIWYVGSRRPGIYRLLELLSEVNLESLATRRQAALPD